MDDYLKIEDSNEHKEDKIKLIANCEKKHIVKLVYCILYQGKNKKNKLIFQTLKRAAYDNKEKFSSYKKYVSWSKKLWQNIY